MHSNFETNLRNYCQTSDSALFETNLFGPLTAMARSICACKGVTHQEYESGIVFDLVSTAATKLPGYYVASKGSAKCAAYILMAQYLSSTRIHNSRQKRSQIKTIYLEDAPEAALCHVVKVEIDETELMKATLRERREVFAKLKNKKIVKEILAAIDNPDKFTASRGTYTAAIAAKCNVQMQTVNRTLRQMRELMAQ